MKFSVLGFRSDIRIELQAPVHDTTGTYTQELFLKEEFDKLIFFLFIAVTDNQLSQASSDPNHQRSNQ